MCINNFSNNTKAIIIIKVILMAMLHTLRESLLLTFCAKYKITLYEKKKNNLVESNAKKDSNR
jgi:hypothetical protein